MAPLDWIVIAVYLGAMPFLSARLAGRQRGVEDYYLGGRRLSAGAVGISTLATQSSAISFISIPAFVALRPDGGLRFLQYELALPAAMAVLALGLVPALRRARVVTIYEFLEQRFDRRVRRAVAALFLLGRGLATGVALYATGLVLGACLGTPLWLNLLIVGAVTIIYDLLGGMTAVVLSDVIQMGVLVLALLLCIGCVVFAVGGVERTFAQFPPTRLAAFAGPARGSDTVASYLVGGLFLYASYYGCDQSQAQRLLSTTSVRDSQRALLLNGLRRFPLILGYCALGVAAAAALSHSPGLRAAVAGGPGDALVPQLITTFLPPGLRGLVFAGLLAAAMSSLDSALNALSASTVRDFLRAPAPPARAGSEQRRGDSPRAGFEQRRGDPARAGSEQRRGDPPRAGSEQRRDDSPRAGFEQRRGDPPRAGFEQRRGDPPRAGSEQRRGDPPRAGHDHAALGRDEVRRARLSTLAWGILITAFAFVVGDISETVIEAINKVGSAVYGPVLGVFLLAIAPRRVGPHAALLGLGLGFVVNLGLWWRAPSLHFLWWNPIGCTLALAVALAFDALSGPVYPGARAAARPVQPARPAASGLTASLVLSTLAIGTLVIITVMWALQAASADAVVST